MGLSDEERVRGLYYDINSLVEHGGHLRSHLQDFQIGDYSKLLDIIENKLWHGLLSMNHNASHWVLGSSATNELTWATLSPWGIAINRHCDDLVEEEPLPRAKYEPEFDAFDGFLDIPGLLGSGDQTCKEVYEIYAWSEQVVYHLRRYDDALLKGLSGLDTLISNIQGECFRLFKSDELYASAYVLHHVCKMVYGLPSCYPFQPEKWDVVTTYIQKNCIHHDLNRLMNRRESNLKLLARLHKDMYRAQKAKKLTKMMRLEAMFELAGRRYHYDRPFKELKEALVKDKDFKSTDIKKLEATFKACKKAHEDDEKHSHEEYDRNRLSPLTIYGISEGD